MLYLVQILHMYVLKGKNLLLEKGKNLPKFKDLRKCKDMLSILQILHNFKQIDNDLQKFKEPSNC